MAGVLMGTGGLISASGASGQTPAEAPTSSGMNGAVDFGREGECLLRSLSLF